MLNNLLFAISTPAYFYKTPPKNTRYLSVYLRCKHNSVPGVIALAELRELLLQFKNLNYILDPANDNYLHINYVQNQTLIPY